MSTTRAVLVTLVATTALPLLSLAPQVALAATPRPTPPLATPDAAPAPIDPDPAAGAPARPLDDIIVTAEKRPESLQKTPIGLSVLTNEDLVNRHVQSLTDLGDGAIPSLRVAPFFSRPGALIVNIRGVGVLSDSNQPARDQGVGVYIDGVYQGRPQGLGAALYDIENIEVLKGPQGTLFGRNTEGGAVNIVTKRPSGVFALHATAGLGNYGSYKGELHLDLPDYRGWRLKLDGVVSRRDGLVRNPLSGAADFNGYDKRGVHAELLWKPAPDLTADAAFDTSYDATTTLFNQLLAPGTGLAATATGPAIAPYRLAALARPSRRRQTVAPVGSPEQPSIGTSTGYRLNLEWQAVPAVMLKAITAYRELTQGQFDNGSAAPTLQQPLTTANPTGAFNVRNTIAGVTYPGFAFARYSLASFRQHQFSEEVQAIGDAGERLRFVLGGLYYREHVRDDAQAYNTNAFTDAAGSAYVTLALDPATRPIDRASAVTTTSIGAYGQATFTPALLDEALHLTAGARLTHDRKQGALLIVNNAPPTLPVGGVTRTGPIPLAYSQSRVDPLVTLAADLTPDVHAYAKWSTGYRSGGANSRSLNYATFDPETVSMLEAGAKTEFWQHRARLNVAAYTGRYKDIQLDFSGLYEDVVGGVRVATTRTTINTVNAPGTGRLSGIEADLLVAPARGLTLTASYARNHVVILATINPFPQTGGVFITVPVPIYQVYTPPQSASGAIDYEAAGRGFVLRAHVDGNVASGYYAGYTDSAYDPVTRAVRYPQPRGDGSLIVNARLALADIAMSGGATATVSLWARNLFDEQHVFVKSGSPQAGLSGFFNDQRTFGGEISVRL
ncbi:TonB-dependent receptor [Sphingomonas sp. BK235]|uniref:TonB-dependent receptor n=1 Tax=Sphingomonas sp. BK235 TaxID=2512131 RepID=UPI001045B7E7|nr:TonB-dependent receptor [Sphingomonas sp. BK235]TCP34317.1 iron complex outermembrane receptor protein [Sphingomonas sp. BK235]